MILINKNLFWQVYKNWFWQYWIPCQFKRVLCSFLKMFKIFSWQRLTREDFHMIQIWIKLLILVRKLKRIQWNGLNSQLLSAKRIFLLFLSLFVNVLISWIKRLRLMNKVNKFLHLLKEPNKMKKILNQLLLVLGQL